MSGILLTKMQQNDNLIWASVASLAKILVTRFGNKIFRDSDTFCYQSPKSGMRMLLYRYVRQKAVAQMMGRVLVRRFLTSWVLLVPYTMMTQFFSLESHQLETTTRIHYYGGIWMLFSCYKFAKLHETYLRYKRRLRSARKCFRILVNSAAPFHIFAAKNWSRHAHWSLLEGRYFSKKFRLSKCGLMWK